MFTSKGMIAFALAGIAMIFLSSVVPVAAAEYPEQGAPPIEYTDFDISKELNPWEDIMILQLRLADYQKAEARDKALDTMLGMPPNFESWVGQSVGLAMICTGLFAIFIVFLIWSDRVKRKLP